MSRQDAEAVAARLQIEDKLLLRCSQPWVEAPSALLLPSGGRSFEVKVGRMHKSLWTDWRG